MKETIVFIHGLTGTKRAFRKQIDHFKEDYKVYSYDLIGHGQYIGKNDVEFTLEQLVKQLERIFQENGIEKAHLCSLSYGCYPSIIFANKWREKVQSMCCIGGHYNSPSSLFSVFQDFWDKRSEPYELWLKKYTNAIYPKNRILDPYAIISRKVYYQFALDLKPDILINAIEHRLKYDLKNDLKQLQIPILWVMGDHDPLYKSCLQELDKINPQVFYKELKHAGHAANLFRPYCFSSLYEEFLQGIVLDKLSF
ncbi:alpha/beta fold hydrolase [Bacillus sp. DJP31]|uniref:alpha/beta fold hydrolase n=1 Tax=Bacillus sp. DJP31 TaxID=3409789 RepID=UPI003BB56042